MPLELNREQNLCINGQKIYLKARQISFASKTLPNLHLLSDENSLEFPRKKKPLSSWTTPHLVRSSSKINVSVEPAMGDYYISTRMQTLKGQLRLLHRVISKRNKRIDLLFDMVENLQASKIQYTNSTSSL
ncbi:hypothetical protein Trydic_g2580 [Trypoxylus dichotomus]